MKSLLYISILLITACNLSAQQVIKGTVTDAGNGQPVDAATVQIRKTGRQLPLTYTLTKADGTFILPLHQADDSLFVHVSLLGYKAIRQKITAGTRLLIRLEPEIFTLKEVEIRPGRVYGQHDTINYDVSQFISPKDEAIKDVLKKLPGVDVDDDGKISYNGKKISKFYVEGMDLTDGRYNQLTNNLQADAVKSVQILENHQPIRALQKKLTTEDIAINLKLKDNFRDRWMGTLEGSMGIPPLLWEGMGNAIQISRKSQSAYIYKGNNRGNNVTDEQNVLTQTGAKRRIGPSIPSFLSQPSFSAPLKKERLLFNNVHSFSGNRIYKLNEATQLRFNINYLHDLIQQERGSITHYYQAGDTVTLKEQNDTHIRTDRAEVAASLENNADSRYLTNDFNLSGNWERSTSRISGVSSVNSTSGHRTGHTQLPAKHLVTGQIHARTPFTAPLSQPACPHPDRRGRTDVTLATVLSGPFIRFPAQEREPDPAIYSRYNQAISIRSGTERVCISNRTTMGTCTNGSDLPSSVRMDHLSSSRLFPVGCQSVPVHQL